eukprot:gene4976-6197_t
MARNEEKAQSMLNRFLRLKDTENKLSQRRPYLSSECDSLSEAEKWRHQIIREISKGISEIQNSSLGEFKIRDLNDKINKLVREKGHWERRIVELGGPNHRVSAPKILDSNGNEPVGQGKYKYYGEAKNLPGVKELLETPETPQFKKSKYEYKKYVDSDYYGYRDEEDGIIIELEKEHEAIAIDNAVNKWKEDQKLKFSDRSGLFNNNNNKKRDAQDINNIDIDIENENSEITQFKSHVPLPSKDQLDKILLEKRKEELRKRYG